MSRLGMPKAYALRENRQLIVLVACFSVGIFAGYIFALLSCGNSDLGSYLDDYFALAAGNGLTVSPVAVFCNCFRWLLSAALFSFTALGVLLIPVLMFLRGFFLTYTTVCFCIVYGHSGLTVSLALFAVTVLIELPATFIMYCEFLRCSRSRTQRVDSSNRVMFRPEVLLVGAGLLILATALQLTVVPGVFAAVCKRLFV